MITTLRIIFAIIVLVFYLPAICGIAAITQEAMGIDPGWSVTWWKTVATSIAEYFSLSKAQTNGFYMTWGVLAMMAVIGHSLFAILRPIIRS